MNESTPIERLANILSGKDCFIEQRCGLLEFPEWFMGRSSHHSVVPTEEFWAGPFHLIVCDKQPHQEG